MLNVNIVPARNLQKFYKTIIQNVKTKKSAVILTTNNRPQAAIVSLEDLETLKLAKTKQSALKMLKLATDNLEEFKSLPADLRDKTNEILYTR